MTRRTAAAAAVLAAALGGCGEPPEPDRAAAAPSQQPPAVQPLAAAPQQRATSVAATAQVTAAVAPVAPPLPYSYLGRWTEGNRTTVLLKRNDNNSTLVVSGLGPIDAQYAVRSIDADRIVLTYLPLGLSTALAFATPPRSTAGQAVAVARPAAPAVPDSEAETN